MVRSYRRQGVRTSLRLHHNPRFLKYRTLFYLSEEGTPEEFRNEHPRVLVTMENFIVRVGWAPIGPAAARADANFLAEYKTCVETPGAAGDGLVGGVPN